MVGDVVERHGRSGGGDRHWTMRRRRRSCSHHLRAETVALVPKLADGAVPRGPRHALEIAVPILERLVLGAFFGTKDRLNGALRMLFRQPSSRSLCLLRFEGASVVDPVLKDLLEALGVLETHRRRVLDSGRRPVHDSLADVPDLSLEFGGGLWVVLSHLFGELLQFGRDASSADGVRNALLGQLLAEVGPCSAE